MIGTTSYTTPSCSGVNGETLISGTASTYSSGTVVYAVSNMNDSTYDEYRCTPTCAGILHFATAPSRDTEVSWYSDGNDFWATVPFVGDPNYNLPKNFTIDGCSASCTGTPPSTGWTTLKTVTGNIFNGGQYVLNLGSGCGGSPCTWLRMDVTASTGTTGNTDASWHMDVAQCASTCNDTWLFIGDSITNNSMGHCIGSNCADTPGASDNFITAVNAAKSSFWPSQIEGGVSFSKACDWTDDTTDCPADSLPSGGSMISQVLAAFPAAHFVTLNLGTNDINGSGSTYNDASVTEYEKNMVTLVQDVIAAGMVPVVPTIPWAPTACDSSAALTDDNPATSGTPNYWIEHTLYADYPQIIHGPDLWTYFDTNQSLINTSNCPHPTTAGQWDYRDLWASTMESAVYP